MQVAWHPNMQVLSTPRCRCSAPQDADGSAPRHVGRSACRHAGGSAPQHAGASARRHADWNEKPTPVRGNLEKPVKDTVTSEQLLTCFLHPAAGWPREAQTEEVDGAKWPQEAGGRSRCGRHCFSSLWDSIICTGCFLLVKSATVHQSVTPQEISESVTAKRQLPQGPTDVTGEMWPQSKCE